MTAAASLSLQLMDWNSSQVDLPPVFPQETSAAQIARSETILLIVFFVLVLPVIHILHKDFKSYEIYLVFHHLSGGIEKWREKREFPENSSNFAPGFGMTNKDNTNYNEREDSKVAGLVATGKFWKEAIIMTLGMMVAAAAVYYFLVPSKLIIGTVSGLSIVLSGIFETFFGIQIKVSLFVVIINAILLVLAWLLIGEEFGAKTVYTAMILGPLMDFWAWVMPYQSLMEPGTTSVMGDIWFDLCCFVLLLSVSQAILFNINASTGGLDILAKIVNKYLHFDIGASVSVAGAMICCTAFAINPFKMVIIGLIGTWINGLVVDYFTASLNKRKRVCIVSHDYEKIRRFIIDQLGRGCSLYEVIGGYTGEKGYEVQSLLTQEEFSNLMEYLKREGIKSFVTAGNVSEVYGLWLKHKKFHF